jgi:hypothetical protein
MTSQEDPTQQILKTLTEVKTTLVGIPGTDDRGMAGTIKRIDATSRDNSEAIQKLCALHDPGHEHMANGGLTGKKKVGLFGGIVTLTAAAAAAVIKAFTGGNSGG